MTNENRVGIWRVVKATVNHKPRTFLLPVKVFSRPGPVVDYHKKPLTTND